MTGRARDLDPDVLLREASEVDPFPEPTEEDFERAFLLSGVDQDAQAEAITRDLDRLGFLSVAIGARPRAYNL